MINIEKFVKIRKKLGLSQTELCDGICTQSTLSKFENNGRIPAMKILNSLCARMDISLADIMVTSQNNDIATKLFDADFATIQFDFPKVARIISKISTDDLLRQKDIYHYYYLRGLASLELDHDETDALFYFNSILSSQNLKPTSVYKILALKGCSQVYEMQGDADKAAHYYDEILNNLADIEISDNDETLQILSVLCQAGEFYGKQKNYVQSDKLLKQGYSMCAEKHVIYFVARILFQLAQNNRAQGLDEEQTLTYIHDAAAFARLNNNRVLLNKIKNF